MSFLWLGKFFAFFAIYKLHYWIYENVLVRIFRCLFSMFRFYFRWCCESIRKCISIHSKIMAARVHAQHYIVQSANTCCMTHSISSMVHVSARKALAPTHCCPVYRHPSGVHCMFVCVCVISAFVLIQPPKQSTANTHTRVRVVRSMSECTSHGRCYRAASVNTPNYNTMRARISRDSVYSRAGLFGRRLLVDISNHTEHWLARIWCIRVD